MEYLSQKIEKKCSKLSQFLATMFNAVQNAHTLHAELNRPVENRGQPSRA